jgi:hypothetical protein
LISIYEEVALLLQHSNNVCARIIGPEVLEREFKRIVERGGDGGIRSM